MCFKSKNLYNYANYILRQEFINNRNIIYSFDLNKQLKTHEAFKALPAKTAQQIIIKLGHNWKAFFKSVKIWSKNKSNYCGKPSLPKYKKKDGRNVIFFDYMQGKWIENKYYFPCQDELFIETSVIKSEFVQCQIIPCGNCYKISIIYRKEKTQLDNQNNSILAIDLGINNVATLTNNIGLNPIIINGRVIKSINNFYNKEFAKAQSYAPRMSTKGTRKLSFKRNNIIDTHTHRISRWIIDYCIQYNISTIVIGTTFDWKRKMNIGVKNNQTFHEVPYIKLISKIQYKAEDVGITVKFVDEKYTSKSSFIDNDLLPEEFGDYQFSGKRIKRGLYKSKNGVLINADVNGSYNILRKCNPEFSYDRIKGLALIPARINTV
jgi:putative transposase